MILKPSPHRAGFYNAFGVSRQDEARFRQIVGAVKSAGIWCLPFDMMGEAPGLEKLYLEGRAQDFNKKLYAYQTTGVARALAQKRLLINFKPGLGKTPTAIDALRLLDINSALVIAPAIVRETWSQELETWWPSAPHWEIAEASEQVKLFQGGGILITSYELAERNVEHLTGKAFAAIILDECFPAGSLVHTPNGTTPIENLRVGDKILAYDEFRREITVQEVQVHRARRTQEILDVVLAGQCIKVTANHPFLTSEGWLCAGDLNVGTTVVRMVWEESCKALAPEDVLAQLQLAEPGRRNREEMFGSSTSGAQEKSELGLEVGPKNAREESDASGENAGQSFCDSTNYRTQADHAGREWEAPVKAAKETGGGAWMGDRVLCKSWEETQRISDVLQNRHSESCNNGSGGSRRKQPLQQRSTRQEKRLGPYKIGLARIESIQRRSVKPNARDSVVYNIQVGGPSTYLVGPGVVVHNCHYVKNASSKRSKALAQILEAQPKGNLRLFLTGTPIANAPVDLHNQVDLLYPGLWGTLNEFKRRYCIQEENPYAQSGFTYHGINPDHADELRERLSYLSVTATEREIEGLLPPITFQSVRVRPSRSFDLRGYLDSFDRRDVHAAGEGSAATRACGLEKIEHTVKLVEEALSSGSTHISVMTHQRATATEIANALAGLGLPVACVTGADAHKKRHAEIARLAASPSAIFVGTMHSIGIGINELVAFPDVIYAELDYRPDEVVQSMKRYHRVSGKKNVRIRVLVLEGTLEERVARAVSKKLRDQNTVVDSGTLASDLTDTLEEKITDEEFFSRLQEAAAKMSERDVYGG